MSDTEDVLRAAREAEDRGAPLEAISLLRQAVSADPTARTWAWLGSLHEDEDQFSAAEEAYRMAITLDPSLAAAHSGLAGVLESTNRIDEAEAELRTSIQLKPTASRYILLGVLLVTRGRSSDATDMLRQALTLEPENEEAMYNLAILLRDQSSTEAESLLRHAISIDPIYSNAYRELAFILAGRGQYADAESMLQTTLALCDDDRWARVYLGNILWAQQRVADAAEVLAQASRVAPLWEVPHRLLGDLYRANGRNDSALEQYEMAARSGAPDASDWYRVAELLATLGRVSEARSWATRVLEFDPRHEKARALLNRLA